MYANQVYLSHGNYGLEAASEFYFGKPVESLHSVRKEAAVAGGESIAAQAIRRCCMLRERLRGETQCLELMARDGKIEQRSHECFGANSNQWAAHLQYPRERSRSILFRGNSQVFGEARTERRRCTSAGCAFTRRST